MGELFWGLQPNVRGLPRKRRCRSFSMNYCGSVSPSRVLKCQALAIWWCLARQQSHQLGMPLWRWPFSAFAGCSCGPCAECLAALPSKLAGEAGLWAAQCSPTSRRLGTKTWERNNIWSSFLGVGEKSGCRLGTPTCPKHFSPLWLKCMSPGFHSEVGKCPSGTRLFRKDLHAVLSHPCVASLKVSKWNDECAAVGSQRRGGRGSEHGIHTYMQLVFAPSGGLCFVFWCFSFLI